MDEVLDRGSTCTLSTDSPRAVQRASPVLCAQRVSPHAVIRPHIRVRAVLRIVREVYRKVRFLFSHGRPDRERGSNPSEHFDGVLYDIKIGRSHVTCVSSSSHVRGEDELRE